MLQTHKKWLYLEHEILRYNDAGSVFIIWLLIFNSKVSRVHLIQSRYVQCVYNL